MVKKRKPGEVIWKLPLQTCGKLSSNRSPDDATIHGNRSPSLSWVPVPWSRGILTRLKGKETIEQRILIPNYSLSQSALSIFEAVSCWCEEFRRPSYWKKIPQTTMRKWASGNRWRECLQNIESLAKTIPFTKVSELASLWHRVEAGMSYKTTPDVDDGFGDFIPWCWECALPRTDPWFGSYASIPGRTVIGRVIQVLIVQLLGNHGFEIEVQSPTNPQRTSWVLICRGKTRSVNALHIPDPGHNLVRTDVFLLKCVLLPFWRDDLGATHWGISGVARAHHDDCGAVSPGRDTKTGHPCRVCRDRWSSSQIGMTRRKYSITRSTTNSELRLKRIPFCSRTPFWTPRLTESALHRPCLRRWRCVAHNAHFRR